jgi:hypothetical protein
MSYQFTTQPRIGRPEPSVAPPPPVSAGRAVQGLGSLDPTPKSYYIALIESYDDRTHQRSYAWTNYQYLGFWEMNSWSFTLSKAFGTVRQAPIIYSWNGQSWVQVVDDTVAM